MFNRGKKKKSKNGKFWSQYSINIGLTIILVTLGILIGLIAGNERLINNEILIRAKSHVQHIQKTRMWNAHYGGVYVEKKEGVKSNPYLFDPDIKTIDGKVYTLKNPALMTREISELFEKDGLMTFHMTSLKPINPLNKPDEFEKKALLLFEIGEKDFFRKERIDDRTDFRYIAPLIVEKSCLKCHAKQGYKSGDIRGGLSVRFDITEIESSLRFCKYTILALVFFSAIALICIIYSFTFVLTKKLKKAQQKIKKLVITDELTRLYNRGYLFRKLKDEIRRSKRLKHDLGCMMIDIDFFKKINNQHGHLAGDLVLENISKTIRECCREIDMVSRYGGEEFIVLLPGTDLKGGLRVAERIRLKVESLRHVYDQDVVIHTTVSIGLASYSPDDLKRFTDQYQIIRFVDKAMCSAKDKGRNRVETIEDFGF